jgi:hypothetical protein
LSDCIFVVSECRLLAGARAVTTRRESDILSSFSADPISDLPMIAYAWVVESNEPQHKERDNVQHP